MGAIADLAAIVYRLYETDGIPASGGHKPAKTEIQTLFGNVEAAIGTAALAGVDVAYDTKAHLDADLAWPAASTALVYADGTDANNDLYVKVGGTGVGSWTNTHAIHDLVGARVDAAAQPYVDAASNSANASANSATAAAASALAAGEAVSSATYTGSEPVAVRDYSPTGLVLAGANLDTGAGINEGRLEDPQDTRPRMLAAQLQVDKDGTLYAVMGTGQSYAGGAVQTSGRTHALTTSSAYGNKTFGGGGDIDTTSTSLGGLAARVELGTAGETLGEQMAEGISAAWLAYDLDDPSNRNVFVSAPWDNGQPVTDYTTGTTFFNGTTKDHVTKFNTAAGGGGFTPKVLGLTIVGGQTDQQNNVARATVRTALDNLVTGFSDYAKTTTGQTGPVHSFITQASYKQDQSNHGHALAVMDVVRSNPLAHFLGPDFGLLRIDTLHPTDSWEYQFLGMVAARAAMAIWRNEVPGQVIPSTKPYIIGTEFYWPMTAPRPLRFETQIIPKQTDYGLAIEDDDGIMTLDRVFIGADEAGGHAGYVLRGTLDTAPTGDVECRLGLDYATADAELASGKYHNVTDSTPDVFPIMRGDSLMPRRAPYWAPYDLQAVTVRS